MDQMARDYAGKAHFVFVYSREAHPDWYDDRPAPTSYEEKLENARDLRAMFDSPRGCSGRRCSPQIWRRIQHVLGH